MDGKRFDALTRSMAQGRSRRALLRGLIGGGAAVVATKAGSALAAPKAKVDICHVTGNGNSHLISVSANAIPAHEAHGDGYLGSTEHCSACGDACASGRGCCDGQCTDLGTDTDCATCGDVCNQFPNSFCDGTACTCSAETCESLGVDCGSADDGCGKTLDCGPCEILCSNQQDCPDPECYWCKGPRDENGKGVCAPLAAGIWPCDGATGCCDGLGTCNTDSGVCTSCTSNPQCTYLDDECNQGICDGGTCTTEPKFDDTVCSGGVCCSGACQATCGCAPGYAPNDGGECLECPVGTYSSTGASCDPCQPGTFGAETGLAECDVCPPGKFAPSERLTECTDCAPGTFADASATVECALCPPGTFSADGAIQCDSCDRSPEVCSPTTGCPVCEPVDCVVECGETPCDVECGGGWTSVECSVVQDPSCGGEPCAFGGGEGLCAMVPCCEDSGECSCNPGFVLSESENECVPA